jgi:hypothetical protein
MSHNIRGRRRPERRTDLSRAMDALEPRRLMCALPHGATEPHIQELTYDGPTLSASGPADIVWTNRGTAINDADRFANVFGANAELARNVVESARSTTPTAAATSTCRCR